MYLPSFGFKRHCCKRCFLEKVTFLLNSWMYLRLNKQNAKKSLSCILLLVSTRMKHYADQKFVDFSFCLFVALEKRHGIVISDSSYDSNCFARSYYLTLCFWPTIHASWTFQVWNIQTKPHSLDTVHASRCNKTTCLECMKNPSQNFLEICIIKQLQIAFSVDCQNSLSYKIRILQVSRSSRPSTELDLQISCEYSFER